MECHHFLVILPTKNRSLVWLSTKARLTRLHEATTNKRKQMNRQEIVKVDLTHFPSDSRFVQIPGKLALADNLNDDNLANSGVAPSFPAQLDMNVCFLCMSGDIELSIDLRNYTLHSGDAAMILTGSFLRIISISENTRSAFIAINSDFLKYVGNAKTIIEHVNMVKNNPVHHMDDDDRDECLMIYSEIKKKLSNPNYRFKDEVAKSYVQILLCNFFDRFERQASLADEPQPRSRKEELLTRFIKLVKDNYLDNRSISFYADKLCVSPKYLSSVVHTISGKYATEWISQFVILEAKSMLRMEETSIKDVSNHLHFANQSFFAKFFKKHTGYTPKEYKAL